MLAACTTDIRLYYIQNDLQLNLDKSGLRARMPKCIPSVTITDNDLPMAEYIKVQVVGVVLGPRIIW